MNTLEVQIEEVKDKYKELIKQTEILIWWTICLNTTKKVEENIFVNIVINVISTLMTIYKQKNTILMFIKVCVIVIFNFF